ncbi:hypothetical protein [Brevundimonas naejangsanensis]|uniref:hypothetical protein n=1 Tax=Brevundimonas naejangsanensis TaxID=588932 RepID=UPI00320AF82F
MAEHHRLRQLSLEELAAEMGGVQEGALSWSKYVAEFKRRAASQQRVSSIIAVTSVVVSALAIVAGSAVTVREHVMPIHPPAADLVVQAKPILDAAALESEIVGRGMTSL